MQRKSMMEDSIKHSPSNECSHDKVRVLAEALPHMLAYDGQTIVIKFGGNAMGDELLSKTFAQDIVYLKQSGVNPIVVHGGGPQIAEMLERLRIQSKFINGLRVTDKPTVEIVEMVLAGKINKDIVASINAQGGNAVGICGKDAKLMTSKRITQISDSEPNLMRTVDIGFVGEPVEVDPYIVKILSQSDFIPVVAPIGATKEGETMNINADTFASSLAVAIGAKRLLLLTDVTGVLDDNLKLIPELNIEKTKKLIRNGTISGGMLPKIKGCLEVLEGGVEAVVIIDGRVPHCVLLELFTDHGVGTLLRSAG
ncbi:MAG: Acetylglutamate kinase [Hyphomicrobiaceae bacterium hypho_1]